MSEQFCVMNVQKRHRCDVKGLQDEANRTADKYKNEVNPEKKDENEWLVRSDNWHDAINRILAKDGIPERRDSVVLLTSVYSASPEWFAKRIDENGHEETDEEVRSRTLAYFEKCLEHAKSRGEVINAVIHFDETTPHMQVAAVPVVEVPDTKYKPVEKKDEKGETVLDDEGNPVYERYESGKCEGQVKYKREKVLDADGKPVTHKGLNAGFIIGNRVKMSKEQTRFYEECGKQFGMSRGEIRIEDPDEAKRRLDEAELKASMIVAQAEYEGETVRDDIVARGKDEADEILRKARHKSLEIRAEASQVRSDAFSALKTVTGILEEVEALRTLFMASQSEDEDTPMVKFMKSVPWKKPDGTKGNMFEAYQSWLKREKSVELDKQARLERVRQMAEDATRQLGDTGMEYGE